MQCPKTKAILKQAIEVLESTERTGEDYDMAGMYIGLAIENAEQALGRLKRQKARTGARDRGLLATSTVTS